MFTMEKLKNHPCDSARSLAVEIFVMSVARYGHVHHCKTRAVVLGTPGESLDIEVLTMKWMVHWETGK